MTAPSRIPRSAEVPERLFAMEHTVAGLVSDRDATRKALHTWTVALVIAMIGAFVTVALASVAGAIAYGELRQTAATNAAMIARIVDRVEQ